MEKFSAVFLKTSIENLAELVQLAKRKHYECEDSWCPKVARYWYNMEAEPECTCGSDEHNERVDMLAETIAYTLEKFVKQTQ